MDGNEKSDIDRLDKIQNLFLNNLLATFNCPSTLMYWDLSVLTISHRILKEKLIFYHHISCLPQNAVARQILEIQQRLHLRGILEEVEQFLNRHQIVDIRKFSKKNWKSFVKRTIESENREHLIESSKKYKKIDYLSMSNEDYGIKDYFLKYDLSRARLKFKERSQCMTTCKVHYQSDKQNLETMFICPQTQCDSIDTLLHWRKCRSYTHLRENRNLDDDFDLLNYYQDVINLRLNDLEN